MKKSEKEKAMTPAERVKVADWKQLTIRIPDEVHRGLKIRAAEVGQPVAVICEKLIREYLVKGETRHDA